MRPVWVRVWWSPVWFVATLYSTNCISDSLPPRPRSMVSSDHAQLYLELVVNSSSTQSMIAVRQQAGHLFLSAADLRTAGIKLPSQVFGEIVLDSLQGARSEYDAQGQRLLLNVPPDWLPEQLVGHREAYPRVPAMSSFGALFNYDLYLSDSDAGGTYLAMGSELRLFDSWGALSSSGQYRRTLSGEASGTLNNGYRRYDTTWRYSNDERLLTYEAGDIISGSLPWSNSVRLGGLQLSRDFGVRPDLVTYPLPQFAGEAAVPSSLDLFVNGYKSNSVELQPGPYTLTNIPFINGAGEAVVVTTDALGRQVSTTVPFYVTSNLLQKGLTDFSLAVGSLRRDYAIRDFGYGPGLVSGSLRYGLSDNLTLESHAEASDSLALGGIGGNLRLGNLGVLNAAVIQSQSNSDSGQQISLGYQYSSQSYSLSYQLIQRREQYADLTVVDSPYRSLSQRSEQLTLSLNLDAYGSLGAGYFDVLAADGLRTRLLNLTWNKPLWRNTSFYLSANREISDGEWALQAQLVIPFNLRGSLSFSAERDQSGVNRQHINYSHSVPTEGGVGFNLGYAHGEGPNYRQADLTWRLQSVQLQAGIYGNGDVQTHWADATGSLVWMDHQVFGANRINDAFVVVSTNGYSDIPVRYENQMIGLTDSKGHLLVPWSSAYYRGKYEIDPLNLPVSVKSTIVEQKVAVRRGSGYLLEFPLSRIIAASVALVDVNQHELPLGSSVVHEQSGTSAVVGWDGLVYLENLVEYNRLSVTTVDGHNCSAQFTIDTTTDQPPIIGPLMCQ